MMKSYLILCAVLSLASTKVVAEMGDAYGKPLFTFFGGSEAVTPALSNAGNQLHNDGASSVSIQKQGEVLFQAGHPSPHDMSYAFQLFNKQGQPSGTLVATFNTPRTNSQLETIRTNFNKNTKEGGLDVTIPTSSNLPKSQRVTSHYLNSFHNQAPSGAYIPKEKQSVVLP